MTDEELQTMLDDVYSHTNDELVRILGETRNDVENGVADDPPFPTVEQMQTIADALQAEVDRRGLDVDDYE